MIRLAGFFVGAALAVASILLVIGVPELPPSEPQHVIIPYEPSAPVAKAPEPESQPEPQPVPVEQAAEPVTEIAMQTIAGSADILPPSVIDAVPANASNAPAVAARQWYSFWSPFRSQIAANGFVSRLESVTGFDYRVVKVDAGIYEVAFAYSDDSEREQKLSTIAAATGLELPDS